MNFRIVFYSSIFLFQFWLLIFANYGIVDYLKIRKEHIILVHKIKKLEKQQKKLLGLINLISDENLDVDLLETQVRKILAIARKNESIYYWK